MNGKIKDKILEAESIIILTHQNQDLDAVGSSFAMRDVLRGIGKKADVCLEGEVERRAKFFGNDFIYEGDAKQYELAIALDCGSIDRLSTRVEIFNRANSTVLIDHHITNTGFADLNCIEPCAAATAEILVYLFSEWGFKLSGNAPMYLYCAILGDSGCFKYSCTSKRTLLAAAELLDYDFDFADCAYRLFDETPEEIMKLVSYVSNGMRSYFDDKVRVVSSKSTDLKRFKVSERDAGMLIDIPRNAEGTLIAVEIKERGGNIRASFRANCDMDVSALAMCFGGGGHCRAAGTSITADSIVTAETMILDKISELYFDGAPYRDKIECDEAPVSDCSAVAYTDGSFDVKTGRFSMGAVLFSGGKLYELSQAFDNEELAAMRNVAGEICAATAVMRHAVEHGIDSLEIVYDYEGVEKWCTGAWKANKRGTITYRDYYNSIKDTLTVKFTKVKSHSNNKYNDMADALAKKALGI